MKKLMVIAAALMVAGIGYGQQMDSHTFAVPVIATATNTSAVVLRGEVYSVKVDVAANATGTVSIATAESTVFSKASIAADATYFPLAAAHTTAGAAATFVGGTNDTANAWYRPIPLAGLVTVTVIGQSAGTNTYNVTVVYKK
jgi:hypothetical protein